MRRDIAGAIKLADHSGRVGTGRQHRRDICRIDPADSDNRHRASNAFCVLQKVETDHWIGIRLCCGRKDGPKRNVVDRLIHSGIDLLDRVCRKSDDGVRPEQLSRFSRRQIVLTEMHALSAREHRDIDTVVYQQTHAVLACKMERINHIIIKRAHVARFFSELNKRRAALDKLTGLLRMRQAGQTPVCDRINFRQADLQAMAFIMR